MAVRKVDNKSSNGHGSGRVKFRYADSERYVDLDMEDANAEVADGIKSLANALSGRQVIAPARTLVAPKATAAAPPVVDQEEIQFPPHGEQVEEEDAEDVVSSGVPANGNGGSGPKRSYNFKTPTFLNELDITKAKKDYDHAPGNRRIQHPQGTSSQRDNPKPAVVADPAFGSPRQLPVARVVLWWLPPIAAWPRAPEIRACQQCSAAAMPPQT
jgi:hypothetical protein